MRRFLIVYFLFLLFLLSLFSSGTVESQDGQQYLGVARQIYYEHWPSAPPYEYDQRLNIHMNLIFNAKDHRYYSGTGLGYSLALVPAVALSDGFHRWYNIPPPEHFPLESDWVVLFAASFVNAFFGALLGVWLYLFHRSLHFSHRQALFFSLIGLLATNLFAYTKHGFAHMMYTALLFGSTYFLRRGSQTTRRRDFVLAGFCFGIAAISYNPIFVLALPALGWYYLLLHRPQRLRLSGHVQRLSGVFLGALPGMVVFAAYNFIRLGSVANSGYHMADFENPPNAALVVLFEGLWGLLLSPGRSFFLYSPILLLPVIFWFRLRPQRWRPEFLSFLMLAGLTIFFYASHRGGVDWFGWHGESSWGPRYLAYLIPFGLIFVSQTWKHLKRWQQRWVFLPLLGLSLAVQLLGVLLPYQIKFHGVEYQTYIGDIRFTTWDYGNFMPRFSPLIKQTRSLAKRIFFLPRDIWPGKYDLRLRDGFEPPFIPWPNSYWRGVENPAVATFSLPRSEKLQSLELELANTVLASPSAYTASVSARLNGVAVGTVLVAPEQWNTLLITNDRQRVDGVNTLELTPSFIGTASAQQQVFLRGLKLNGQAQSLRRLNYPYAQPLAEKMSGERYRYWGTAATNNWDLWYMRSAVYENTLDLWWLRPLYYWDLPHQGLFLLFLANVGGMIGSGYFVWRSLTQSRRIRL